MSLLKKPSSKELTERLFFHDIINLTHALLLFLSNKKIAGRGIDPHELPALEKEIRTLQMMLKDHYRLQHKNLDDSSEWLPLSEIKPALNGLLETYLGSLQIPYSLQVKQEQEELLIYLPVFYRIMNNLIKNMSEAKTSAAQIDLIFEEGKLLIETKNKITESTTRSLEGLGLESIRLLALEHGGHFTHESFNHLWCNHVVLPLRKAEKNTKAWTHKKAS